MNIEELKRLAEAATPGPWEYTHAGRGDNGMFLITEYFVFIDDEDTAIAACILDPKTSRPSKGNAAYIAAANPAIILELIQQRDELLAALKALDRGCRDPRCIGVLHGLDLARTAIAKAEG